MYSTTCTCAYATALSFIKCFILCQPVASFLYHINYFVLQQKLVQHQSERHPQPKAATHNVCRNVKVRDNSPCMELKMSTNVLVWLSLHSGISFVAFFMYKYSKVKFHTASGCERQVVYCGIAKKSINFRVTKFRSNNSVCL